VSFVKKAIFIIACLGTMVLSVSVVAKSEDQKGIKMQSSVTDTVYGKDEILK
jgi:hypothetical protein